MPTARFGITLPTGASTPDVVRDITAVTTALESTGAMYSQGTIGALPTAAIAGRIYFATDQKALYYDTGSAWSLIASQPLRYANAGPAVLLSGSWGVLATAVHLPAAAVWQITMGADFISTSVDTPRVVGLDIDVSNGSTHYRTVPSGDALQTQTIGSSFYKSASKQSVVTTPGAADVSLYGTVFAGSASAYNLKLVAELVG